MEHKFYLDSAFWLDVVKVLLIPLVGWAIAQVVTRALNKKDKLADERHQTTLDKLAEYNASNETVHAELITEKNNHANRLTAIETVHRMKGCSNGFLRRETDKQYLAEVK